ncbi:phage tail sheath family protein [Lysobacter yangpyeongensis]|uniref:Phage tail sheath family protein n=1 Tax=Lysobacter yangpyeongensis TaxID=346182 RepID=A0ABW0SJK8_9GAMM
MPALLRHPGVYIEEIPSGVRTITGVATSITAFVGRAWRGQTNEPVAVFSYADYEREFGGLWRNSSMSYAVQQYFLNGGSQALIVRVAATTGIQAAPATITLNAGTTLVAANPGTWGRNLRASVDHTTSNTADTNLFNLEIYDDPTLKVDSAGRGGSGLRETFRNVSIDPNSPRFVTKILAEQSTLARMQTLGAARPTVQANVAATASTGSDGILQGAPAAAATAAANEILGSPSGKSGMYALLKADLFNLLCIPPLVYARETTAPAFERLETDVPMNVWTAAATFCNEERALLLVDAPAAWTVANAPAGVATFSAVTRKNAALYFPRIRVPDPLRDNQLEDFAPCGAVAGIMARTDAGRGVWKAPAGIEANLAGVLGLSINAAPGSLTDQENGTLNPLGINCLRNLPNIGHVVWGARTLEGNDALASEWKYVPVRRLAMFLEETLFRGTQWVVFEPNDEPLWAQIRLNVGAFMHSLFIEGAFQGATPREAYYVRCSRETTTQADIDKGVVNIEVGFAPLKPAEFVVIKFQQMTQQAQV